MTSASRHPSHYVNWLVDFILLTAVTIYLWREAILKRSNHSWVYGPTYLVGMGAILILADPTRHVLQDWHLWHAPMYISNCPVRALQIPQRTCIQNSDCGSHDCGGGFFSVHPGEDCFTCWEDSGMCSEGAETFGCLSTWGWLFTIVCTYLGFLLFFVGVLWNSSSVFERIARQWKQILSEQGRGRG